MDVDQPSGSSSTSPLGYLEHQEASSSAELKPLWTRIRTQYEKKWDQIGAFLHICANLQAVAQSHGLIDGICLDALERTIPDRAVRKVGPAVLTSADCRFISTIESKINALKLVEIARRVGREYSGELVHYPSSV